MTGQFRHRCPRCKRFLRGLLDTCSRPTCLHKDLNHDLAIERRCDQ